MYFPPRLSSQPPTEALKDFCRFFLWEFMFQFVADRFVAIQYIYVYIYKCMKRIMYVRGRYQCAIVHKNVAYGHMYDDMYFA